MFSDLNDVESCLRECSVASGPRPEDLNHKVDYLRHHICDSILHKASELPPIALNVLRSWHATSGT